MQEPAAEAHMSPSKSGVIAIVVACTIWGLSPIYYKLLVHVPPAELLAQRIFWSFVTFYGLLTLQKKRHLLSELLTKRQILPVSIAALMVSANWFLFIFAVQTNRSTETSLGYYIFPLFAVLLGVVFFKERLSRLQLVAITLATAAVLVLVLGQGLFPWISLVLAVTFALYGAIKKRMTADPIATVTAETVVLLPLAAGWLLYLRGGHLGQDLTTDFLLIFSGLMTALPLVFFSYASQRVSLTTLGLVQYLNPTLQFFCAVVLFNEPFGLFHAVAFGLIWTALIVYSSASIRQEKARRKSVMADATSGAD